MENIDLIVGIHSVYEAIKNSKREIKRFVATKEGVSELSKKCGDLDIKPEIVSNHALQEIGKDLYNGIQADYRRISSGVLLLVTSLEELNVSHIYSDLDCGKRLKIIALDQVTDIHNAAAILRTAAFFGVDYLITAQKGNFGSTPSFFKIASGAMEYVPIIRCSSLSKTISRLSKRGFEVIGFSEHAIEIDVDISDNSSVCLVVGAEDVGLSNAVDRVITNKIALKSFGDIKSLNVSVASAVAMERFFKF